MTTAEIHLRLAFSEAGADDEQLDELTTRLLRDLGELGADSVERAKGEAPPASTKGDPFTWGALALAAAPAFLPKLLEFLQAWSLRGESRKIKIKTSAGLEVEFTPEKKLSEADVLDLAQKMSQIRAADEPKLPPGADSPAAR